MLVYGVSFVLENDADSALLEMWTIINAANSANSVQGMLIHILEKGKKERLRGRGTNYCT